MATYVKGDAVTNATKYDLKEKNSDGTYTTLVEDASEINFEVSALGLEEGDHNLVVVAQADGYTDSDPSNEVVFTVSSSSTDEGDTGDTGETTLVEIEGESVSGYLMNKTSGELVSHSTGYHYKFEIEDATATYYGTGFAPNSSGTYAAVAYYTSGDTFISYEDFGLSSAAFEKQLLTVPENTGIIRIQSTTAQTVVPELFIEQ